MRRAALANAARHLSKLGTPKLPTRHAAFEDANVASVFFYLFRVQEKPSFVSFTSKPRAARSSRILSLKAQFFSAFAA